MTPQELSLAIVWHKAGRLLDAEAAYLKCLARDPAHRDATYYLAGLRQQQGRFAEAGQLLRGLLARIPDDAAAWLQLGIAERSSGGMDEARSCFERAVQLQPANATAHYNLGVALATAGRTQAALSCFDRALGLRPDYALAHGNRGAVLGRLARWADALESCDRALVLNPALVDAHANRGAALVELGRWPEAFESLRRALDFAPEHVDAWLALGKALQQLGRLEEAEENWRRALAQTSRAPAPHASARAKFFNNLGTVLLDQGKIDEAQASYRQALAAMPDFLEAQSNLLLSFNYVAHDPADYRDQAQHYGRMATRAALRPFTSWRSDRHARPLRVGLVSGDLREHPVGYFLEGLVHRLDRQDIALYAYPTDARADALTDRIRPAFAAWNPIVGIDDAAAAALMHDDGLHVLLDLSGHTANTRLPLFAWRPAPVQASWLGYFASTGLPQMDCILVDRVTVPEGEEAWFTERVRHLPRVRWSFTPPADAPAVGPLPADQGSGLTFCCFNNLSKVGDPVLRCWAQILASVPRSRLLLKSPQLRSASTAERLRSRFAEAGGDAARLYLEGPSPRTEYLRAYARADVALDPFPFSGGATSAEALWMGVPLLTLAGDRMVSRQGLSLLSGSGLDDWIAATPADYVRKARELTLDLPALARLRSGMRGRLIASPAFNSVGLARDFSAAMEALWTEHVAVAASPAFLGATAS